MSMVTLILETEDMMKLHELAVAHAVTLERVEVETQTNLGSGPYRRAADAIRRARYGDV